MCGLPELWVVISQGTCGAVVGQTTCDQKVTGWISCCAHRLWCPWARHQILKLNFSSVKFDSWRTSSDYLTFIRHWSYLCRGMEARCPGGKPRSRSLQRPSPAPPGGPQGVPEWRYNPSRVLNVTVVFSEGWLMPQQENGTEMSWKRFCDLLQDHSDWTQLILPSEFWREAAPRILNACLVRLRSPKLQLFGTLFGLSSGFGSMLGDLRKAWTPPGIPGTPGLTPIPGVTPPGGPTADMKNNAWDSISALLSSWMMVRPSSWLGLVLSEAQKPAAG